MEKKQTFPLISVVIPALNEAKNLCHVLPLIPSIVSEVILVDGHSIDDTLVVIEQLRTTIQPTIHIIKQTGRGKGDALRLGFAACSGDIIVTLDADGSADPREIPLFVEALLRGNDFAKGSRCILGGGSHDFSPLRRLGNYWLHKLVNLLFRTRFSDLCYGYNAFWRHCLDSIEIDCDGFEIETLMHLRVYKAQLRIVEVPSVEYRRIHGKSNLHAFRDGWGVLSTIVKERSKGFSPLPQPRYGTNPYIITNPMNPYIITDPSSVPEEIVL
jgi:glycosyltransferase involved in cell wall biosynthesis